MYDLPSLTPLLNSLSDLLGFPVSLELLFAAVVPLSGIFFLAAFLQRLRLTHRSARQKKRIVRELLQQAITQHSKLKIEFGAEETQDRELSGCCVSIANDTATVDVGRSLQARIGGLVEVSFKIAYKNTDTHYRFSSRVISMRDGPPMTALELELPPEIIPIQHRNYIRICPLPGHLLGLGLWPLKAEQPLPTSCADMNSAALSYRPGKLAQCSLLDLSATGMYVEVSQELLQRLPADTTLGSQLLCLLLLRSPDSDQFLPFWLACTIIRLLKDPEEEDPVCIGMKFKAWALSEVDSQDIAWFPAGRLGEVTPLASWVLRHQMEQNARQD